jgi:uncharacterized membrane protein YdbT with pleckstrin-like domain
MVAIAVKNTGEVPKFFFAAILIFLIRTLFANVEYFELNYTITEQSFFIRKKTGMAD